MAALWQPDRALKPGTPHKYGTVSYKALLGTDDSVV